MSYSEKFFDLLVVVLLVFVVAAASIFLNLNFLITTILFFGLPSSYLLYKKPNNLKKVTITAVILGLVWGFSFDYIAELNNAWEWASNTSLVFPVTFFGVVSLDIMVWYFLWIFSIIAFYEYFVEFDDAKKISKNALPIAVTGGVVAIPLVAISRTTELLYFSHTYLWLGAVTLIPYAYVVLKKPKLFTKSLLVVPYFFFMYFVFELTALYGDLWSFSGEYIGSVTIGSMVFPFEELFYWMLTSSAVAVAYYEHAVDDAA